MGSIYLIRHGQASFGKADYDELSPKGHQQSEVLGRFLKLSFENTEVQIAKTVAGTLKRHRQTAAGCMAQFDESYTQTEDNGFNEFDHLDVIHQYRPAWEDKHVMAQELAKHKVPRKGFEEAFEQAVKRWVSGEYDDEYREPWPEFKLRVETAFDNLVMGAAKSENILVFTSGGPISVICGKILGLDTRGTFSINQNLANAGVTRALYSANRVSLSYFNNFSHLEQEGKGLLTYR